MVEATFEQIITYTVAYSNGGDIPAPRVRLTDTFPARVEYVADSSGLANPAVIPPIVEIGGVGLRVDEPQGGVLIDLLATVDGVDLSLGLRTDRGAGATDRAAVRLRLIRS